MHCQCQSSGVKPLSHVYPVLLWPLRDLCCSAGNCGLIITLYILEDTVLVYPLVLFLSPISHTGVAVFPIESAQNKLPVLSKEAEMYYLRRGEECLVGFSTMEVVDSSELQFRSRIPSKIKPHLNQLEGYRESLVQGGPSPGGLGLVDLDFGCSTILLGQYVATVVARQQGELPKSKSPQPRFARRWATLYFIESLWNERLVWKYDCIALKNKYHKVTYNT